MRIAVLADIHGNIDALEAVYKDLKNFSPDMVLIAGDIIGGGPDSKAVCDYLDNIDHIAVKGTHEELMLGVISGKIDPSWSQAAKIAQTEAMLLGQGYIDYFGALPDHRIINLTGGIDICLAHGIPGNTWRTICQNAREDDVESNETLKSRFLTRCETENVLEECAVSLFITAHSHSQFCRPINGVTILNPGCVQGEFSWSNEQALAEYALIDLYKPIIGGLVWHATLRQIPWPEDKMNKRYERIIRQHPVYAEKYNYYRTRRQDLKKMEITAVLESEGRVYD
ncbi:MAG: metallophosphoesterase family protein [Spirochaetales bacterium]|jgi:predicted phosphodiesterase|nr:metallophosphoesterase family protein [Spirochaetales bacterium]